MRNHKLHFLTCVCAFLVALAPSLSAEVPRIEVTVVDSTGRVAFEGATKVDGTFATKDLRPGRYLVRFRAKGAAIRGDDYVLILSAGIKPFLSNPVPGENFATGGVAIRMDSETAMKITGQVESASALARDRVRVVNGRRYFYVLDELGTHLGGRWIDETAVAMHRVTMDPNEIRKMQDRAGEGSLIGNMQRGTNGMGH